MVKFKKNLEADASADNSADSSADCSVDRKLQEIFGFTDEKLLAEFEAAERDTRSFPIPSPPANEFETIWTRIQEEAAAEKNNAPIIRVRFRWRRLAAVGLIACLVAGGSCMVALGRKSYFYRERTLGGDVSQKVLVNDDYIANINGEEMAYKAIEEELGITPLKLGYIPADMKFRDFELRDGYAKIDFVYENTVIYFIQSKYEKTVSYKVDTDGIYSKKIYNKWLNTELTIEKEDKANGQGRYVSSFIFKGSYYSIMGSMDENEFIKIVERLLP